MDIQGFWILGKITLVIAVFFGPLCVAIYLIHRDKTKCEVREAVFSIAPHRAILLAALPICVMVFGLVWALATNGNDILPIHAISMIGMILLIFSVTREIRPGWRIDWTNEYVEGPRQFAYFQKHERVSIRWEEVVAIRQEGHKIILDSDDGRTIVFARNYRGYLTFLRAIYDYRQHIRDTSAPREWFSDEVRTPI